MKILIDNGHGLGNPNGSPAFDGDGHDPATAIVAPGKVRYFEYKFTRLIARQLCQRLLDAGYDAQLLVPEEKDVSLAERSGRANRIWQNTGKQCILISIHSDAAKGGPWAEARGWSAYTSPGQTQADGIADSLYQAAEEVFAGHRIRKDYSDSDPDLESSFYILKATRCPAVLTENFYHNNHQDLAILTSPEGRDAIVDVHFRGITSWINTRK